VYVRVDATNGWISGKSDPYAIVQILFPFRALVTISSDLATLSVIGWQFVLTNHESPNTCVIRVGCTNLAQILLKEFGRIDKTTIF
jgi:hypothetical protein